MAVGGVLCLSLYQASLRLVQRCGRRELTGEGKVRLLNLTRDLSVGKRELREFESELSGLCGEQVLGDELVSCVTENSADAGELLACIDRLSDQHEVIFFSEYPRALLEPVMSSLGWSPRSAGWRLVYCPETGAENLIQDVFWNLCRETEHHRSDCLIIHPNTKITSVALHAGLQAIAYTDVFHLERELALRNKAV